MKNILAVLLLFALTVFTFEACTQQKPQKPTPPKNVGGPCEGCEALLEYGKRALNKIDTIPGFEDHLPQLKITGRVLQADGKTPAQNVILYIYQTNREGNYKPTPGAEGWATRHGQHRGWVKTDDTGRYTFYTFRPGAYPNRRDPEHVHLTVKEPGTNPYYLDSYVFVDDPLLTTDLKEKLRNRGGSGITLPTLQEGMLVVNRDLILGLNIPEYHPSLQQKVLLEGDTISVDFNTSQIRWKGTKLKGLGKHEGRVEIKSAYLIKNEEQIIGGKFIIDMNSISVTDIPKHETIPRTNLINHLKSDDFFDSNTYPEATFELLKTEQLTSDSLMVSGNLTIKNISHAISFPAHIGERSFSAIFQIDGFKWDIGYSASWIEKALVDREIKFQVLLVTHP